MKKHGELRDYDIIVTLETSSGEDYYVAKINELETIGDGCTPDEAIKSLLESSESAMLLANELGLSIPKPEKRKCSGAISLRLPKFLHEKISDRAHLEGVSINQLIISALSWFMGAKEEAQKKELVIHQHTHNHYNNSYMLPERKTIPTSQIPKKTWRAVKDGQGYC